MFRRLLVPLDGSALAERAIPVAARLAQASHGSILLLRVVSTLSEFGMYMTEPTLLMEEATEQDLTRATVYLAQVARSKDLTGINTQIAVFSGTAALTILDVAQDQQTDLIVMCSHGSTGSKRWATGSVAQKITRYAPMPVLVLRGESPEPLERDASHPFRSLVALDGTPFAESAIVPATYLVASLAAPPQGVLHLAQVVKLPTIEEELENGRKTIERRKQAISQAGHYLQSVTDKLSRGLAANLRVNVTWSVEECKDVADALIKVAEHGEGTGTLKTCDLIALTTHGRAGLQRWMMGSVSERVLGGTKLPLLIVHPQEESLSAEEREPWDR